MALDSTLGRVRFRGFSFSLLLGFYGADHTVGRPLLRLQVGYAYDRHAYMCLLQLRIKKKQKREYVMHKAIIATIYKWDRMAILPPPHRWFRPRT
jgi:hypothetical protein